MAYQHNTQFEIYASMQVMHIGHYQMYNDKTFQLDKKELKRMNK